MSITEKLIASFESNKDYLTKDLPKEIIDLKMDAFEQFKQTTLPTKKDELWRFTSLEERLDVNFLVPIQANNAGIKLQDIFSCDVPNLNTLSITLLNGFYMQDEPQLQYLENGAIIGSLREAMIKHPDIVFKYYGKQTQKNTNGLISLNTALATDGLFIYVPDNTLLDQPIQVINVIHNQDDLMIHQRNLFIVGKNSSATIVVCDHSLFFNKSFTNRVTEAFAEANAQLVIHKLQNSSNNTSTYTSTHISQKRDSNVLNNIMSLHGGFVRNDQYAMFEEEGCNLNLYGLYITDHQQHIDNYTCIDHTKPNCTSNEVFKGILDDQSTGVFRGQIIVRPDAQKTQAYQSNKNILLSDEAKIHSLPQLEIYADDVKCSHGSTTGQLDADALFYLRARGIDEKEAKLLLMYAFAGEIINTINIESLRLRTQDLIAKRLRGEMARCNHCMIKCS